MSNLIQLLRKTMIYFSVVGMLHLSFGEVRSLQYIGFISSAHAQTTAEEQKAQTQQAESQAKAQESIAQSTKVKGVSGTSEAVMQMIVLIILALVGASLAFKCKAWSADVILFEIASVTYLIGEVLAFGAFSKANKEVKVQLDKDLSNEEMSNQLAALHAQKAALEKALKAGKQKYQLQNTAASMIMAAATIAGVVFATEIALAYICEAAQANPVSAVFSLGICLALAAKTQVYTVDRYVVKSSSLDFATFNTYKSTMLADTACSVGSCVPYMAYLEYASAVCVPPVASHYPQSLAPFMAQLDSVNKKKYLFTEISLEDSFVARDKFVVSNEEFYGRLLFLDELDSNFLTAHYTNELYIPAVLKEKKMQLNEKVGVALNNLTLNSAKANQWLQGMGIVGALGAAVLVAYYGNAAIIDTYIGTPGKRMIVFAIVGAIAKKVSGITNGVNMKIQKSITQIEALITELEGRTNNGSPTLQVVPTQQVVPVSINPSIAAKGIQGFENGKFPCALKDKSGKCLSAASALQNDPKFDSFPPDLQAFAIDAGKFSDGISGKDNISGSTLAQGDSLSARSGAIKKRLTQTQNKANSTLKKSGQAPINFEKRGQDFLTKVGNSIKKGLASKGESPESLLNALGSTSIGKDNTGNKKEESNPAGEALKKIKNGSGTVNSAGGKGLSFKSIDFGGIDKLDQGDEFAENQKAAVKAISERKLNDISKDKDRVIFEQISNRYKKTAYPVFLYD